MRAGSRQSQAREAAGEILVLSLLYTTQTVGASTPDVIIESAFGKQLKRLKTVGAARRFERRQYECATDTRDHPNRSRMLH
jgi:hypothetical protein